MEFKCFCPHCQQHLIATEEHLGQGIVCPNCKRFFVVSGYKKPHLRGGTILLDSTKNDHPIRDSFLRLVLHIAGYAVLCGGALVLQIGAGLFAYSMAQLVIAALGDSLLVKVGVWIGGFVVAIAVEIAIIWPIVWVWCAFEERWPNNPVTRLVEWQKDSPSYGSDNSDY